MCRYAAYLGPPRLLSELIYKPSNSLVHQATDASLSQTRINADGFGVGWYAPEISPEPALFKDTSPVWSNYNLGDIAGKIRSGCILAHVRAARSYDPVSRENCHPFRRGRLLWMHNGDIPGRVRLTRQVSLLAEDTLLAQIRGNTDTELALTLFLTHLGSSPEHDADVEQLVRALELTLAQIVSWHVEAEDERPLELNFLVTTGSVMVASRYSFRDASCPSLHWRSYSDEAGATSVVVASEPLSKNNGWNAVPRSRVLLVTRDRAVEVRKLELPVSSLA